MKRHSQRGVALVITLILLSVITFMAVTFLVVSRHEGTQVDQITQQANAKLAAESAFEQAKIQIIAPMLASTNGYLASLLVSTNLVTNFYNGGTNLTDVSYAGNGIPLTVAQLQAMLNNLLILPRPPVFIVTNKNFPNNVDFRFYNDMNRNGKFDTNGLVAEFDITGAQVLNGGGIQVSNIRVGDPEWIGILNHPEQRHSASNFFIGRYCFIALPIGNSLDINYIHNHAKSIPTIGEGFFRNEGVGSYEINLAGFLNGLITNTLSTNYWDYQYNTGGFVSIGRSFFDADAILEYRYNNNYLTSLSSFDNLYTATAGALFRKDFIDGYVSGPLLGTNLSMTADNDVTSQAGWAGADNPNQYFTVQDILNHAGTSFVNRLEGAGTAPDGDSRYAFYRMLSQLSFGSASEPASYPYNAANNPNFASAYPNAVKMNLNYNNLAAASNGSPAATTNFVAWKSTNFFLNAADRMLRAYFPNQVGIVNNTSNYISITNIPIYPTNYYTPAVHRILQLAANMWDASANRTFDGVNPFPTVFRPQFSKGTNGGLVFVTITNYLEDDETGFQKHYNAQPLSLPEDIDLVNSPVTGLTVSIYGIPWVIGARKGLPNFNQFTLTTVFSLTRRIQLVRLRAGDGLNLQTNIQYQLSISNLLGVSAWNSYTNTYARQVDIIGTDNLGMCLNASPDGITPGPLLLSNNVPSAIGPTNVLANTWIGYNVAGHNANLKANSFVVPLSNSVVLLSNAVYHPLGLPIFTGNTNFDSGLKYYQPHFMLFQTNRLRFIMVDHQTGRLLDYVNLNFNDGNLNHDLTLMLTNVGNNPGGIWDLNRVGGVTNGAINGVNNQISVSLPGGKGDVRFGAFTANDWTADTVYTGSQIDAQNGLFAFMLGTNSGGAGSNQTYTPTKKIVMSYTWQANDPLIHYMTNDLTPHPAVKAVNIFAPPSLTTPITMANLSTINGQFEPWGNGANGGNANDTVNAYNMALKDSQISKSDDWQFPTNKYPNVGWLGRVHRGTPWQTVYLKAGVTPLTNWVNWTGNTFSNYYSGINDPAISQPTNDYILMDLFTTSPNDNSSRGQLSVNQSGLAAWAAVLDGVEVVSNSLTAAATNLVALNIDPNPPGTNVQLLVNSINAVRSAAPYNGSFTSVGQVLAVPQLTTASPYINPVGFSTNLLRDEVYERIPQQIMGLLRNGTPKYVIFAYGQSLKPADGSIVTSGKYFGMPTNYTITGEMATRTVMRIDNFPTPNSPAGTAIAPRAVIENFTVLPPE